jgi:ApaG protein
MTDFDVEVNVKTEYLAHQSKVDGSYAFAYHVEIKNKGSKPVQLMHRYWLVTSSDGRKVEVAGEGVIGQQPVIAPLECFNYSSGAMLETPVGTMEGYYEMVMEDGELVRVLIQPFGLSVPNIIN